MSRTEMYYKPVYVCRHVCICMHACVYLHVYVDYMYAKSSMCMGVCTTNASLPTVCCAQANYPCCFTCMPPIPLPTCDACVHKQTTHVVLPVCPQYHFQQEKLFLSPLHVFSQALWQPQVEQLWTMCTCVYVCMCTCGTCVHVYMCISANCTSCQLRVVAYMYIRVILCVCVCVVVWCVCVCVCVCARARVHACCTTGCQH
jgi:hypothetical protein